MHSIYLWPPFPQEHTRQHQALPRCDVLSEVDRAPKGKVCHCVRFLINIFCFYLGLILSPTDVDQHFFFQSTKLALSQLKALSLLVLVTAAALRWLQVVDLLPAPRCCQAVHMCSRWKCVLDGSGLPGPWKLHTVLLKVMTRLKRRIIKNVVSRV